MTASYWYWVMLLEILRPPADSNVAIKDTLQPCYEGNAAAPNLVLHDAM